MKKLVFFTFIAIILFFTMPVFGQSTNKKEVLEFQVIPDEAIRLRILANSDTDLDQDLKHKVRDRVNEEITNWVQDMTDIQDARTLIRENLSKIEAVIGETLAEAENNENFNVKYDKNVTFPAKIYGNYLYPAGEYEAVLVTIGEGKGSNWWCVLFPPLCFLDFSNGTSVADVSTDLETEEPEEVEEEEVTVKFFLFDWISSLFS
ncbi:stage II sporulation protein R [Virgibacillus soli]|uniref:Stage II sporulation protein R n=1 Tax=Paracerasibacillus soli TaxID=480284 RepID=A0ABU5CSZ5_9BACI|nr:stage II sporulation protein R [Virgibacillus soli]MDY0409503.1 stage II sporulation protein R [Virgibacillus soli]